jgi:hypothetical protein
MAFTFPLQPIGAPRVFLPHVDDDERDELEDELREICDPVDGGPPTIPFHLEALHGLPDLVEMILEDDPFDVALSTLAHLVVVSTYPATADGIALQIGFGRHVAERRARTFDRLQARARRQGSTIDEVVAQDAASSGIPLDSTARLFRGETSRAPFNGRIERGIALMRRTISLTPEPLRPGLLCTLAWLYWAQGDQHAAHRYLAAVTREEPGHVLGLGLGTHFARVTPGWITHERSRTKDSAVRRPVSVW